MQRIRWVFLPLGLCALVAVGVHSAADRMADVVLWGVDRVDAFFDAIFSSWSVTAPLVDLVGLGQRTFFARAVALAWELAADVLLAIPLLGYDERKGKDELALAKSWVRKPSLRLVQPAATLLVALAGARSISRMVQGTLYHFPSLGAFVAMTALFALLVLLAPRAVFRSLEYSTAHVRPFALVLLLPIAIAAVAAL